MQRYWFKPKRYGFGAAPSSWQGWALTGAYVLAMFALSGWLASGEHAEQRLMPFFVLATAVTIIFVGIAWRTTEGGWRWRWGDKK